MPRTARRWEPGGILHVDARAFEGFHVFARDEDREFVLATLEKVLAETRTRCLAWAVLVNHFHLLLQCDETPPGAVMLRVNTRIALRARRFRGESGAIFQDRYFSRECTDDRGYEELLAYVLGNPLRHRVVADVDQLERHRWTGLRELLGTSPPRLIDVPRVLEHFDAEPEVARACLRSLLRAKAACWDAASDDPDELPEATADAGVLELPSRVLADESLRHGLQAIVGAPEPLVADWGSRIGRRLLLERDGWKADALLRVLCRRLGAERGAVAAGQRSAAESLVRAVFAFLACEFVGVPSRKVARLTGVRASAIVGARRRGREILARLGWDPAEVVEESRVRARQRLRDRVHLK